MIPKPPINVLIAHPTNMWPRYDSPIYESAIDGNVWSPEAYPAGWRAV